MELIPPKGFIAGPPWGVAGLLSPKPANPEARLAGGVAALLTPPPDVPPAGHMQESVSSLPTLKTGRRVSGAAGAVSRCADCKACREWCKACLQFAGVPAAMKTPCHARRLSSTESSLASLASTLSELPGTHERDTPCPGVVCSTFL